VRDVNKTDHGHEPTLAGAKWKTSWDYRTSPA